VSKGDAAWLILGVLREMRWIERLGLEVCAWRCDWGGKCETVVVEEGYDDWWVAETGSSVLVTLVGSGFE